MHDKRDTYKYYLKVGKKIVDVGITDNMERQEQELQKEFGEKARIVQQGRRTTRKAAQKWKIEQLNKGIVKNTTTEPSRPDTKFLYARAAGICSFPTCWQDLVPEPKKGSEAKQIGHMAHIIAKNEDGARADSSYPPKKLNKYENLILLCGTHHNTIDTFVSDYPVDRLHKMKREHEEWVNNALGRGVQKTTFAELEVAAKAILLKTSRTKKSSFELLEPTEKLAKNNLTAPTHNLIVMGMSRSREIGQYIKDQSVLDENYPERLKKGFRVKYDELVRDGIEGDELFESMLEFSSGYSNDFARRSAGLIILTHLFELCEIFEK